MAVPGVVGTAIGRCDGLPCIRVFVAGERRAMDDRLPRSLEGYLVHVEVTGTFRPR